MTGSPASSAARSASCALRALPVVWASTATPVRRPAVISKPSSPGRATLARPP